MDVYQEAVARLARKDLPQVAVRKGIARFSNTAFRIHSLGKRQSRRHRCDGNPSGIQCKITTGAYTEEMSTRRLDGCTLHAPSSKTPRRCGVRLELSPVLGHEPVGIEDHWVGIVFFVVQYSPAPSINV